MITIQNSKDFTLLFEEMFNLAKQKTELVDIKLSLNISKMMTALIEDKQSFTNTIFSKHKNDIENAKEFIECHYESEIDISMLSQSVNISKFYFIKLFKELVGQTPYEYLIGVRINNSKRLLKETDLSICEIALLVGFRDINNYIKAFKKLTGTTPLKFKLHWVV
jgi:YesN/AraC family two-component response regulator